MSVSCALKQSLAKGFTLTGGLKYGMQKGHWAAQRSVLFAVFVGATAGGWWIIWVSFARVSGERMVRPGIRSTSHCGGGGIASRMRRRDRR